MSARIILCLLLSACSTTPATSSNGDIEGVWDLIVTGGVYQAGTLTVAGSGATIIFKDDKSNVVDTFSGTLSEDRKSFSGTRGTTTTFSRTGEAASSFGAFGGTWSSANPTGCSMSATSKSVVATCAENSWSVLPFRGGTLEGTLSDGKLTGSTTSRDGAVSQFAATRR